MTKFRISELDRRLADYCHAMTNPRRAMLIKILGESERAVSELVALTEFGATNVSQHLKVLRDKHIVAVTRQGGCAKYRLNNAKVLDAMQAMREAFTECLREEERLRVAAGARPDGLSAPGGGSGGDDSAPQALPEPAGGDRHE